MTEVARLTPAGTGAVATVAVRGGDAWPIAQRVFRRADGKPLPDHPGEGRVWYGRVGGERGDEVILAVRRTQPTVWTEYHCHGGKFVTEWLVQRFEAENCTAIDWAQFMTAPGESTDHDPHALRFLPKASTLRTASLLLDQYHGAYRRAVRETIAVLKSNDVGRAQAMIAALLRYAEVGIHLTRPWRIAIAGLPNAGKSSLMNALAGYRRSVVSAVPGTTRDVVATTLAFRGWPVELSDTAGLRESTDAVEREGVARAQRAVEVTDLCVWLLDVTDNAATALDPFAAAHGLPKARALTVLNKTDLSAVWDVSSFPEAVAISALTGKGIDTLIDRMMQALIPDEPLAGTAIPYSPERVEHLRRSQKSLADGAIEAAITRLGRSTDAPG